MTERKPGPEANENEITQAGAVELDENSLDDASGGLLPAYDPVAVKIAPVGHKLDPISLKIAPISVKY